MGETRTGYLLCQECVALFRATGDYDQAETELKASVAIEQGVANPFAIAWPQNYLGWVACARGNYDEAAAQFAANLASARTNQIPVHVGWALHGLGYLSWVRGEHERAVALLDESLACLEKAGWIIDRAFMLNNLARAIHGLCSLHCSSVRP